MFIKIRRQLGALFYDVPRYVYCLYLRRNPAAWIGVKNREDEITKALNHDGVACSGKWTSDLYLPKVFPRFTAPLLEAALRYAPIKLRDTRQKDANPEISIIIGHKGEERLPLLLKTLQSIAAQRNTKLECIVVEQDFAPHIQERLPSWVNYFFMPMTAENSPYSRAKAFNFGAQKATTHYLIFHDNDLLVPENYASELVKRLRLGFEFINLKRFIFYLTRHATKTLLDTDLIQSQLDVDSVLQNALGGGSVGASKKAFNEVGGFDERFSGWGGEDNEFWERAETRNVWNFANLPLIHLWHPAQPEKTDYNNAPTKHLYHELSKIDPAQRVRELTASTK